MATPTQAHFDQNPYSFANFMNLISNNFALIFIMGLFFLAGFMGGSLWTENQFLKGGGAGAKVAQAPSADPTVAGAEDTGPTKEQLDSAPEVEDNEPMRGNKNAKITLIEYSDFECPFCARFHPTTKQVLEEFPDDVKLVYRHYPLSFHPNAQKAAEASECVQKQKGSDGFWAYADYVFGENEKAGAISPAVIEAGAQAAGANMDAFKKCLDSGEMAQKVKDQMDAGAAAGVQGTPGTIVRTEDGETEFISGALPFEQVKTTIEKYL